MPEVKIPTAFKVEVIESERGWGQRLDEVKYFDNRDEALSFVRTFNAQNTAIDVPDWYMYASYCGKVE